MIENPEVFTVLVGSTDIAIVVTGGVATGTVIDESTGKQVAYLYHVATIASVMDFDQRLLR